MQVKTKLRMNESKKDDYQVVPLPSSVNDTMKGVLKQYKTSIPKGENGGAAFNGKSK
jgi:hypothetical protein